MRKKEAEGDVMSRRDVGGRMEQREMEDDALEHWKEAGASPGELVAARSWKKQGMDSPRESPEEAGPC